MKSLLSPSERRQLEVIETLFYQDDWITLSELSHIVDCSTRILKYDFQSIKNTFTDFRIESSYQGIRLKFESNIGLKTLYHNVLNHSITFKLLEMIFLDETKSIPELADLLFISPSTLYRTVHNANEVCTKYNFYIKTSPVHIFGSEKDIRYFFYQYFYEKYSPLESTYKKIDLTAMDHLLYFIIEYLSYPIDFASFQLLKITSFVNLIRFSHGHSINTMNIKINNLDWILKSSYPIENIHHFEQTFHLKMEPFLINQMLIPFTETDYFLTYGQLINTTEHDAQLKKEVDYLNQLLDNLALQTDIILMNKPELLLSLLNSNPLRNQDPRSGYILYNRNHYFVKSIEDYFPDFLKKMQASLNEFRQFLKVPFSTRHMNYMIYILFTNWENLIPQLEDKFNKIKVLILSNRNTAHSQMIKDFIEFKINEPLSIDIYKELYLSKTMLEASEYEIFVANFPLPKLQDKCSIYIENIPTTKGIQKIQTEIDKMIRKRFLV